MKESAIKNLQGFYSDEELQELAEQPLVSKLLCSNKHEVTSICYRSSCNARTALCCNEKSCTAASIDYHQKCLNITNLTRLTSLLENQRKRVKLFLLEVLRIESDFFDRIRSFSQAVIERYRDEVLQKQHESVIRQLLGGNLKQDLSPQVASQLMKSLSRRQHQIKQEPDNSIL